MKIKLHQLTARHRQTLLLGLLVASASLASSALAEEAGDSAKRKAPRRLPTVTATISADHIPTKQHTLATSTELAACSAEALVNDKSDTSPAATGMTVGIHNDPPTRWLRSSTSSASAEVARRMIAQATREYGVGASLSAETSAWTAIRWAAESVDLAQRENGTAVSSDAGASALDRLQRARQAIREARDFSGIYGSVDARAITRMAKSHLTDVLDDQPTQGLSATDAADRYLDDARVQLAPIAAQSVEAAQAMDLLAAIYLRRADARTLPSSTALCLRRAALQGQPGNASLASRLGMHLADVGLVEEARWALEHSLSLEADPATADALVKVLRRSGQGDDAARLIVSMQNLAPANSMTQADPPRPQKSRIKIPEITQLSPADFAALSKPVMQTSSQTNTVDASLVSAKKKVISVPAIHKASAETGSVNSVASEEEIEDEAADKPGALRRLMNSFKRIW